MPSVPAGVALRVILRAVQSSDHRTPATGVTGWTVTVSKNGATPASLTGSPAMTEVGGGDYRIDVAAADVVLGPLVVYATASGVDPVKSEIHRVVSANNGGLAALPDVAINTKGGISSTVVANFSSSRVQTGVGANQFLGSTSDTTGSNTNLPYGAMLVVETSPFWQAKTIVGAQTATGGGTVYSLDQPFIVTPGGSEPYRVVHGDAKVGASLTSIASAVLRTSLTNNLQAVGTNPTLEQGILTVWKWLTRKSRSGTTITLTNEDGTPYLQVQADSATNPTSITRL